MRKLYISCLLLAECLLLNSCNSYPKEDREPFDRQQWLNSVTTKETTRTTNPQNRIVSSSKKPANLQQETTVANQIAKEEAEHAETAINSGDLDEVKANKLEAQVEKLTVYSPENLDWWRELRDPNFMTFIQVALNDNLELEAMEWRLENAKAQLTSSRAKLFPNIDANAQLNKTQIPSRKNPNYGKSRNYSVGLDVSYELDVWGRNFKATSAAKYAYLSKAYEKAVLERTIISNVASSYLDVLYYREMENITNELKELNNDLLVIAEKKFQLGSNTQTEVLNANNNLEQAKNNLSNYELQRNLELTNLKLLLGISAEHNLPVNINNRLGKLYIPSSETVVLSTALLQRPDVKVAQATLEQMAAEVGVAKRDFLPKFNISAGGAYNDNKLSKLINAENLLYNLGVGLTAPLFQGGKILANYQSAKANYEEAISNYQQVVLTAIRDVQDSLKEVEIYRQQFENSYREYRNSEKIYELELIKYEAGSTEYSDLLSARQTLLTNKSNLWQGKLLLIKATIKLHKATGAI